MDKSSLVAYQKEWAYQKYWVMAHSQQHYNALRLLFKGNTWSQDKVEVFETLIAEAESLSPTTKTLRTVYQHVWGYFKKVASPEEKERFRYLDAHLVHEAEAMQDFLVQMTDRYQPSYLIGSRLMTRGL